MTIFTRITEASRLMGQAVLAFMVLTICYDAAMRYVFAAPTSWSHEVNTFLIVYLALLTAADAQRTDSHIRITFFTDRMHAAGQRVLAVIIALVGVVFCAIMAWRGGLTTYQAWEYGERVSSSFGTPLFLPYALLPLGFGLLGVQFLMGIFAPPASSEPDADSQF